MVDNLAVAELILEFLNYCYLHCLVNTAIFGSHFC